MTEKTAKFHLSRANGQVMKNSEESVKFWKRIEINEGTFSFFLFAISLSIVVSKLCINYGHILYEQNHIKYTPPSIAVFTNVSETLAQLSIPDLPKFNMNRLTVASEKFVNVSSRYEDIVASAVISFNQRYGWLIRAALSGLIMMGFTWFIIYKDSSIPGINPPFPFSPSKQRFPEAPKMQLNYLVGILNGILIFVYMCL